LHLGASTSFVSYGLFVSVRPALSIDNAKMLDHAFVASLVDYCNSILYQAAASSSSAGADCCCVSDCQEEEMAQYHPDHS